MPMLPVRGLVGTVEVGAINTGAAKVGAINAGAAKLVAIDVGAAKSGASKVGADGTTLSAGLAGASLGVPVVVPVVMVGGLP